MEFKKKRSENWNEDDKSLLQKLVREKVDIVENKKTDTNTNNNKIQAWKEIEESFNLLGQSKRCWTQLRGQWAVIKMNAKKKNAIEKKAVVQTGGGPPPVLKELQNDDIRAWLPNEFAVEFNDFDSDNILSETLNISQVSEVMPPTKEDDEPQLVAAETSQILERPKKSRKRNRETTTKSNNAEDKSVLDIANTEMKCRLELHQFQVEAEKKKIELYELQIQNEIKKSKNIEILVAKLNYFEKKM